MDIAEPVEQERLAPPTFAGASNRGAPAAETQAHIHRALTGDEDAFEELFHAHKNLVFKTAYLLVGNVEEAEDALQEVFILVHRSLRTYQPNKGAFTTWLYRITTNHCLGRRRKRRFRLLAFDEVPPATVDWRESAHERRREDYDVVWSGLRKLSDKSRAVIVLRFYADLSYAEIADVLDVPLGTVKSRLSQALRSLRHEIEVLAPDDARTQLATLGGRPLAAEASA